MIQWHPHTTNSAALGSDAFIGTTAAIIAGLAAAGSTVAGAEIQAHGASNAAKTQSDAAAQAGAYSRQATDRALGYIQQGQQGIQQAPTYGGVTPFGGGSSGAYGTMARLMGGSQPQGPSMGGMNLPISQMPQNGMGGIAAGAFAPSNGTANGMTTIQAPNGQSFSAPSASMAAAMGAAGIGPSMTVHAPNGQTFNAPSTMMAAAMGGAGITQSMAANGGTVMMRAPNGQTKAVPANQVDHYTAQGARRI